MAGAEQYMAAAHEWATLALVRGDQEAALRLWNPSDERAYGIAFNMAAGWLKAVLDLAEVLGVEPGTLWARAVQGPLKPPAG